MVEALTPWKSLDPQAKDSVPAVMLTAKGQGTDDIYAIEVDQANGGLPVVFSGTITATNPSVGPTGSPVPADATMVGGTDGTNLQALHVTSSGVASVDASSTTALPLPTGAATATLQGTGNTSLASIDTKTPALGQAAMAASSPVVIASNQSAVPVSAVSLPLPTGGATSALQTTGNTSLASIDTKTPALGQAVMASSVPVVLASNQSAVPVTGSGNFSVIGTGTAGSAATGVVTVQGIASGTAVATSLASIPAQTTSTATFQAEGSIAFGSITGSYATVFTPSASTKIIQFRNNTNQSISCSYDAGTTLNAVYDPGDQVIFDLQAAALVMSVTAIQIKATGTLPTVGSFRVNGCH